MLTHKPILAAREERRCHYFEEEVAAFQRTLADIRALGCSHAQASGQLKRTAYGYSGSIVCDDCGHTLQTLGRVSEQANGSFCFTVG